MMKKLTDAQEVHIMLHCHEKTCKELAAHLQVEESDIYNLCNREGYILKKADRPKKKKVKFVRKPRMISNYVPDPPKKIQKRWPAVYGNIPSPYKLATELYIRYK